MAKPIAGRRITGLKENVQIPMLKVDEVPYWAPPKGMLLTPRTSRIPKEFSAGCLNMMLSEQTHRCRFGLAKLETVGLSEQQHGIMAVAEFVSPDQVGYLLRLTQTALQLWNGASWATPVFVGFTGGLYDYWTFVNWGEEILMTNGINKIFRYNPILGLAEYLDESPPAKHINVFGGRVIASAPTDGSFKPVRVKWSVKNDNEDWTGEGSGWEDLYAAPGGRVDAVHGCFPITDDTALLIREQSIWQMSTTGQLLAPFRFSKVSSEMGTKCRRAIAEVPGGYVVITKDNVVVVGLNNIAKIGDAVREVLLPSITAPNNVKGIYDAQRSEYRLAVGDVLWRYSFREEGWTKDQHPNLIRDLANVSMERLGITINQMTGTIDGLVGTIDEQTLAFPTTGMLFVEANPTTFNSTVLREDQDYYWDWRVQEATNQPLIQVDSPNEITTGLLQAGSVLQRTKLIECQVEYECQHQQPLIIDYSSDGAQSWNQYSRAEIFPTVGPQIKAMRQTIVGHNIQLRLRTAQLRSLRVLSFIARVVEEGKVNP